ncbi:CU044_5270 family protein [Streptosporangium sp. NPDC023963]|uniref:CU044_5270 family protein n=1 Tax=Streptosporangium sp. NPDC023963 TaxID=3155608 RepID=UPI0034234D1D
MDDLDSLRRMRGSTPAITPAAEEGARARLLNALHRPVPAPRRRVRRLAWRTGTAVALTAALAAAITVGLPVLRATDMNPIASVRDLGERAARAAETEPAPEIRADQWLYVKQIEAPPRDEEMGVDTGRRITSERWTSLDGGRVAWYGDDGQIITHHTFLGLGEISLALPPVTPETLLARIDKAIPENVGWKVPETREQRLFQGIYQLMTEQSLSPPVRAALFRALPMIDGVSVRQDAADADGRRGVAFSYTGEWARYDLILNPDDYDFLGTYGVSVQDRTFGGVFDRAAPEKNLGTMHVKAGTPLTLTALVDRAVVDRPGQRP